MNLDQLKAIFPDYAKDIRLNISKILSEDGSEGLNQSQVAGVALASAFSTKSPSFVKLIEDTVANELDDSHHQAAKLAASLMAMNNIYYRFAHLVKDDTFSQLPAGLRMQGIANPGIDKLDFEMYSLAISAINGCGMCMDSHTSALMSQGLKHEGVQSVIRIASVIHAAAQVFSIENNNI